MGNTYQLRVRRGAFLLRLGRRESHPVIGRTKSVSLAYRDVWTNSQGRGKTSLLVRVYRDVWRTVTSFGKTVRQGGRDLVKRKTHRPEAPARRPLCPRRRRR